jgi:hypothetical protein
MRGGAEERFWSCGSDSLPRLEAQSRVRVSCGLREGLTDSVEETVVITSGASGTALWEVGIFPRGWIRHSPGSAHVRHAGAS